MKQIKYHGIELFESCPREVGKFREPHLEDPQYETKLLAKTEYYFEDFDTENLKRRFLRLCDRLEKVEQYKRINSEGESSLYRHDTKKKWVDFVPDVFTNYKSNSHRLYFKVYEELTGNEYVTYVSRDNNLLKSENNT